jgi:uncharacterized phage-associated protein
MFVLGEEAAVMPGSAKAVANKFLRLARREGRHIDPLQMQKFVYLAQGWTLGLTDEPLFQESIEAWDYGPVVPSLYHSLKLFGSSPIVGLLKEYDYEIDDLVVASGEFDMQEEDIISAVWEKYGTWSGPKLINFTHKRGAPWAATREANPSERDARISRSAMRDWFAEQADEASRLNYG